MEGDYPIGGGQVLPASPIADRPVVTPGTNTSGRFINAYGQPLEIWVDANSGGKKKQKGKSTSDAQKQVGGPGTLIPIPYGLQRRGARISYVGIW
jgi:hypothetical protein